MSTISTNTLNPKSILNCKGTAKFDSKWPWLKSIQNTTAKINPEIEQNLPNQNQIIRKMKSSNGAPLQFQGGGHATESD